MALPAPIRAFLHAPANQLERRPAEHRISRSPSRQSPEHCVIKYLYLKSRVLLGKCGLSALVINSRMMTIVTRAISSGVLHEKIVSRNVFFNSRLWACWLHRQRQGSGWQGQSPSCSNQGLISNRSAVTSL
jgi:hypothetical protein